MTNDEAREYFKSRNLSYQDITAGDICVLVMMLNKEIDKAVKNKEISYSRLSLSEKIKSKYNTNGTIKECYLFLNSENFLRRECISFNKDGFIGFAGWAGTKNTEPIIKAFIEWCDYLVWCKLKIILGGNPKACYGGLQSLSEVS